MPSIAARPLHLLEVDRNHHHEDAKSFPGDPSDSDSEESETSTFTNSPLSFYRTNKPSNILEPPSESLSLPGSMEHPFSFSIEKNSPLDTDGDSSISSTASTSVVDCESGLTSSSDSDMDLDAALVTKAQSLDQEPTTSSSKKSVGFESLSTLYIFDDDASGKKEKGFYDIDRTWYSSQELKSFRADAFLTVKWMVMKNINPRNKQVLNDLQSGSSSRRHSKSKNTKKYGYDRQMEIQTISEDANYEFCERGIECRTPLGRFVKNKHRVDAMRVVMLYQQMLKQHRRDRRREARRQQQKQYHDSPMTIQCHKPDPEALRRIEADIDADALSSVYGLYCKDSSSEALARGQADAISVGMPTASKTQQKRATKEKTRTLECPSLCDEENVFIDNLITSSLSIRSENSLSLYDLAAYSQDEQEEDPQEVSGVVEVELIEGNEEHSHRIHCSESTPAPYTSRLRFTRCKYWSHPELKSALSCASIPNKEAEEPLKPPSASFSNLELGGLLFWAVTGLDWW